MEDYQLNNGQGVVGGKYRDPVYEVKHGIIHYPVAYELELHRIIQLNAYYHAEKDGFKKSPLDYWLTAEDEVLSLV